MESSPPAAKRRSPRIDAEKKCRAAAKQLANAGATIVIGTWPPVLTLFERGLKKGFGEDQKLLDGSDMEIAKAEGRLQQLVSR